MATWNIDPTHSEIQFKVKHLVISTVTGNFKSFNGSLTTEGDSFENASVKFEADIDSITTNNADRDTHLKSDDFFNAEQYPKLKFESTSFKNKGGDNYELTGNLTIRDITKEVTLNVEHGGTVDDPYGQTKAGFEINGSVNRKEFGLKWNAVTEAGSVVVADQVKLHLNVQVVESAPVEA
ncbi:YceI family protein [Gracilimonas sp.]|uniref:YceI family protein n=1 Tax=Gracilimonas sp. TaxID=1974203 RepID=UPI0032EE8B8D